MAIKTFYPSKEALVYGVSTTVSQGAGRDYHLPAGNVWVGGTNTGNDVRSLIQFALDFSDVSAITDATLYLTTARADDGIVADYARDTHGTWDGSEAIYVRQLLQSWNAGVRGNDEIWYEDNAVNWLNKPNNNGATNRFSLSSIASRPASPQLVSVSITSLVQAWFSGSANYGLELSARTESSSATTFQEYYSSHAQSDEGITGAVGPYIELTYTAVTASNKPIVRAVSPTSSSVAKISNLNDGSLWSSASYSAGPEIKWSITPAGTAAINSWRLRIWEGTTTAGTQVFESGTVTAEPYLSYRSLSLGAAKPGWMPGSGWAAGKAGLINGSNYAWALVATDSKGSAGSISATPFQVRWSQAVYEFDAGTSWSQTSQWSVTPNIPEKNTSIGIAYRALSATDARNGSSSLVYAKGDAASMTYYLASKNAYVTNVSSADGTLVTYAGTNTFAVGDYISVSGISTSTQYNLSNVNVTAATGTSFTVASTATGAFSHTGNNLPYAFSSHPFNAGQRINVSGVTTSAGTNTYNVSSTLLANVSANTSGTITAISNPGAGTVRYTASNSYSAGDRVTIYGVNPVEYNLSNAAVTFATATYFEVANATTSAYVSSAGRAQALTAKVNIPGSATYSSGGTAEVAWSSDIADVIASGRYLNAAIRLSSNDGVNQPYLNSLAFEYTTSIQTPDNWYATNGTALLDTSVRRFGTKSAKFSAVNGSLITETANISNVAGDGTAIVYTAQHYFSVGNTITITGVSPAGYNLSGVVITAKTDSTFTVAGTAIGDYVSGGIASRSQYDGYLAAGDAYAITADVSVVPNTTYTVSAYVKPDVITEGNEIRVRVFEGGATLGAVIADSGPHTDTTKYAADNEGWYRLSTTFNTGVGQNSVRPTIYLVNNSGVSGNSLWSDGASLEEGSVVRSWTPGFVTTAITFEGGGLNIDGYGGGSMRLRGAAGGQRDIVELSENGLNFGGAINPVPVYSDTSSSLIIGGTVSAQGLGASGGTVTIGADTSIFRQSADKLATSDTFVLTGGTVEFGVSNDVNLYRSASNYLKTDDVFFPANMTAGIFTGTWSVTDAWSVTGLSVLSSAGSSGGTANFAITITPYNNTTSQNISDIWKFAVYAGSLTFAAGRLTGFTVYTAESGQYTPDGFYWMVIGI